MYNNNNSSNIKLKINPKYEVQIRALTSCEYLMLRNSMQVVGQRIPIIVDKDGNIIDGHHRFRICLLKLSEESAKLDDKKLLNPNSKSAKSNQ